jgi:hypothetical protein
MSLAMEGISCILLEGLVLYNKSSLTRGRKEFKKKVIFSVEVICLVNRRQTLSNKPLLKCSQNK